MRAFVDTNTIVRHLTGHPPDLGARATRFLQNAEQLFLPDLNLAEVVYVLESYYEVHRARVAEIARAVLAFDAITVVDPDLLLRAIELYEVNHLDFADAYLVTCAEVTGVGVVASYDQAIGRIPTVRRLEPPAGRRRS